MANEITIGTYLRLINGNNKVTRDFETVQANQSGDNFYGTIKYDLTGTYESLAKGDIGSLGWAMLENSEAAAGQNVVVSFDSGVTDHLSIPPGKRAVFPLVAGITIANVQVKAATSAASVIVTLLEA